MKGYIAAGVYALSLFAADVQAQADKKQPSKLDRVATEESANMLATCAGVWDWLASTTGQGKPAVAERLHNLGNGAEAAAQWTYATYEALVNDKLTRYGSWDDLTQPKRDAAALRMAGLLEMEDFEQLTIETKLCQDLLSTQEDILQSMREDRVKANQGE